ncbi:LOW QUALITY PROTEIN: angiopoietin-related protein 2-like [Gymnodraco acuticeps]|uniref:LOW QUALITY PROTEIN: angiopoietin-related protein 2-like n=1 Tax=Gymnodraco acuticeps TaxID=8218 RepID=A0A6P8TCD4_GYMAC|nr:LOW QUALITY PROTEIN: angiopoietin-related protein 2-like [Gymnodraco acuticeps]
MILPAGVLLWLLLLSRPQSSLQEGTQEIENSDEIPEQEFIFAPNRQKRAVVEHSRSQTDKCSYTFIVPEQKSTGAICVNSKEPEELLENRVNKQELELLNTELQKQRRQIEALQQLIQVDGGVVNEVKLLRKESRNMNSRVTQLYMQLLHEIIRKRDNALEASQLETRVLNHTNQMGTLGLRYSDLEHKYRRLSALANNQSALLLHLEKHCQRGGHSYGVVQERIRPVYPQPPVMPQPPVQMPELSPGGYRPYDPQKYTRHTINRMNNDIQNDQNSKAVPPPLPTMPSSAHSFTSEPVGPFKDCLEAVEGGYTNSGMFLLKPDKTNRLMQVWCDQTRDPGGWTVIQRRTDGSVNFFRNWETYKQGFGNIDGEHWLGLENIYWLTNQATYKLLVTLEDWSGRKTYAEYASFRIESEADFYRLRVGRYQGNAGDSLTWHNGKQFTTLDKDNDAYTGNCAHYQKGGWWYKACAHSNMNGVWYRGGHYRSRYQDGVYWAEFRGGAYSLKKVTMMIRPNANTVH